MNTLSQSHEAPSSVQSAVELSGRVLLVTLFVISGIGKITGYAGTAAYMESVGVPGLLLPAVIALEVLGSVAILLGWQTRLVALLFAGFTVLAALLFHGNIGDQTQQIMFLKNIAIAGGFLLLVVHGAGPFSLDARRRS